MTYVERRAALGRRLIAVTGVGPVVVMAVAIGLTVLNDVAAGLIGAAFLYMLIGFTFLCRNWPTEIRLDDDKVHIGLTKRKVRVTHQNRGAFECPWRGVTGIRVVTDRAELKRIRTSRDLFTLSNHWGKSREVTRCMLGVLTAPLMPAALIVELYPGDATFRDQAGLVLPPPDRPSVPGQAARLSERDLDRPDPTAPGAGKISGEPVSGRQAGKRLENERIAARPVAVPLPTSVVTRAARSDRALRITVRMRRDSSSPRRSGARSSRSSVSSRPDEFTVTRIEPSALEARPMSAATRRDSVAARSADACTSDAHWSSQFPDSSTSLTIRQ
jgi:hypothetical protein